MRWTMTDEWVKFDIWDLWVLIAALALFVLLFTKEWLRTNKKNRVLRILISSLAVFALLMIWMKPAYQSSSKSSTVLLLTDGYSQEQVDSLDKEHAFSQIVYFDSMSYQEKRQTLSQHSALLVGKGIDSEEIQLWQDFEIQYLGNQANEEGFSQIHYERENSVGEVLTIKGNIDVKNSGWLKLSLLGKAVDSIEVSPDKPLFTLNSELKTAGRFIHQLSFFGENTAFEYSLPVIVNESPRYKILMVNAFPTFELKYLKNYLAEAGHAISVRNQITRGRYKFEFFNTGTSQFYRLDEKIVTNSDLLIIDRETLSNLSRTELNTLQNAIENGLGLFVMPDEGLFENRVPILNFRFQPQGDKKTTIVLLGEEMALDSYGYTIEDQFGLSYSIGQVSAQKRMGLGKIATTTLQITYNLLLKGEENAYAQLWKEQLEAVARQPQLITLTFDWPVIVDHPVNLQISGVRDIGNISAGNNRLFPIQDMHIATNWSVTFWPKKAGWQNITINEDSAWVYVNDKQEWPHLRQLEQQQANKRAFTSLHDQEGSITYWQPIKPLWFYLLFLLCIGYLWLEPKLS